MVIKASQAILRSETSASLLAMGCSRQFNHRVVVRSKSDSRLLADLTARTHFPHENVVLIFRHHHRILTITRSANRTSWVGNLKTHHLVCDRDMPHSYGNKSDVLFVCRRCIVAKARFIKSLTVSAMWSIGVGLSAGRFQPCGRTLALVSARPQPPDLMLLGVAETRIHALLAFTY